jgi:hypothetical protein
LARQDEILYSCNSGEISVLALTRTDLAHLRVSAQSQVNWLPRTIGPMMLRPGSEFIGEINNDLPSKFIPFVAAFADTALIELTDSVMRVWVDDGLVTRIAVGTVVPAFGGSWVLTESGTATASVAGGLLTFANVNNGAMATAVATVNVALADQNTEHAVRIVVNNGPVNFQIGSTPSGADVFGVETLDTGTYSMAFTPGNGVPQVFLQFSTFVSQENFNTITTSNPQGLQQVQVASIAIEGPGPMIIPSPWPQSAIATVTNNVITGPSSIRHTESADVIFVAAAGIAQYQINRYSPTSWSIVLYKPVKGPMSATQGNPAVLIAPSAQSGNITLNSNNPIFKPQDVGTLFRLFHNGQNLQQTISFDSSFTDTIEVTGVSSTSIVSGGTIVDQPTADRNFTVTYSGTWTGTVSLQRSFSAANTGFTDYTTSTANGSSTITDGLNNEIVWYRAGFEDGNFGSGNLTVTFVYAGGGAPGVCHITGYNGPTQVTAEVLVPFSNTSNATDWRQSEWSVYEGYPSATVIHQGRLWWSGSDRWWGSTSDDYSNFDFDAIGDSAYIDESIGQGPIANINWMLSIDNLIAGADTSIIAAISDATQDPLTPTNFNLRQSITNGAFPIQAVRMDNKGIYVDQSGRRLYQLIYDIMTYNYKATDLTRLNPDIGLPGFIAMSIQRQPDTRINLVRTDGVIASFVYDIDDEVQAFWKAQTNGVIEDVFTLPGALEDQVYFTVRRTIGGVQKRYLEKFARIDECQGGTINKNIDSHLVYQGAATNVIGGFNHLIGQTVVIWGGPTDFGDFSPDFSDDFTTMITGPDFGTAVVDQNGDVTIPGGFELTSAVIGLPYDSEFISAKLAYAAQLGSAINQIKRVDHLGLVLSNSHAQGIRYGQFTPNDPENVVNGVFTVPPVLDNLPLIEYGAAVPTNMIWQQFDGKMFEMPSDNDTDVRLYLQASSPRPCTVLGVTFAIQTSN